MIVELPSVVDCVCANLLPEWTVLGLGDCGLCWWVIGVGQENTTYDGHSGYAANLLPMHVLC